MDIAGNVWEWLNELCLDPTAASWNWYNVMSGYGQIYMPSQTALHALIGGGPWHNGVHCGSRAVDCNGCPWDVHAHIGVRCVTVCNLPGWAKAHPIEKYINRG